MFDLAYYPEIDEVHLPTFRSESKENRLESIFRDLNCMHIKVTEHFLILKSLFYVWIVN